MLNLRINRSDIVVHTTIDESPDLSYLGEYTDKSPIDGSAFIDRRADMLYYSLPNGMAKALELDFSCGWHPGEYKYYVPCNYSHPGNMANWKHCGNKTRHEVTQKYGSLAKADIAYLLADLERLESASRGDWCMLGIFARVPIVINGIQQYIQSGGLWGIESDSGDEYIAEVKTAQIKELYQTLHQMGMTVVNDDEPTEHFE